MEELRRWVRERYLVKVFVMSSYEASVVLGQSGFTPEEFLQPFCEILSPFSVKSLTKTISFNSFKVQVSEKLEFKRNESILSSFNPKVDWQDQLEGTPESIQKYLSNERTPWFHAWKKEFFKSLSFSQHELIDMPLAILYLASTTDTDPLHTFQTLARTQGLPPIYQSKVYDSAVPKVFLLIHDPKKSSMTSSQISALYDKIQRGLAPNLCYFQTLNSSEPSSPLIWEEIKIDRLSHSEKLQIQATMKEIIIRAIVPYAETKLKSLDMILEQKKRGLKNSVLKIFSKNKDRSDVFLFQVESIEHVSRLLADLAFLFGDYEEAASHYKTVSNDMKNLKAWAHAGSAFEMMSLCSLFTSGDIKESEYFMDTAYAMYQKSGDQALICRCLLITRQIFYNPDTCKRLALKLLNGSNDVKEIKAAYPLLMEQIGLCYMMSSPSYFRKFAFYQIIAGDEYRKLDLVQHALNCYYSASHIYQGKKWDHIEMHIQHMLGRFCYFLNLQIESVHFYLKLTSSHKILQQKEQHQKKIVNELLATIVQWAAMPVPDDFNHITNTAIQFYTDGKPILEFSLPRIVGHTILLPQDKLNSNKKAVGSTQSWKSLLSKECSKLLEDFKYFDGEIVKTSRRTLYSGESIDVVVRCHNPMGFLVSAESITVVLEHEDGEKLVTERIDKLELGPNEEKNVSIQCKQDKPGKVFIKALRWSFGNVFYGTYNFVCHEIAVKPAVSSLTMEFLNFPDKLLEGQIQNLQVLLKNQNTNSVSDILITFSHGHLFGKNSIKIDEIDAGALVTLDVWIRGETIGSHTVKFLVTYKSQDELRYYRLQMPLEITSSLKVHTRYDYSLKEIDESIIQLVIKPGFEARLSVKQIASLSDHKIRIIKDIASEVYYIGVKQGQQSSIKFDEDWVETIDTKSEFSKDVKNMLKQAGNSNSLDLIISWELEFNESIVTGYHYLLDLKISKDTKKKPLHMVLLAPTALSHDFGLESLCQVPVEVVLKNISDSNVNFFIQALQDDEFPCLTWVGTTSKRVSNFRPGDVMHLNLLASFQYPGCYNLNKFSLKIDDTIKDLPSHLHQILIS
jgi:tetratricopeptide (TPR) repeat protein